LRERLEDIPALVARFVDEFCRQNNFKCKEVDPEVVQKLRRYTWPGNIRELKNVVERMVIMSGDRITAADVPASLEGGASAAASAGISAQHYEGMSLKDVRDEVERDYIRAKLEEHGWNITKTAQALEIERTNLHKKIKQLGIKKADGSIL
jgi:DNA-binding NtrC family response regulator